MLSALDLIRSGEDNATTGSAVCKPPSKFVSSTSISVLKKEQYEELSTFLASFPGETRSQVFWRDRLSFWWDNNPSFTEETCRGWIMSDGQTIVGFLGIIPTKFQLCGQETIVFNSTTWRVLDPYRGLGIGLLLKAIAYSKNTLLFDTTPTDGVAEIARKLKFRNLPRAAIYDEYQRSLFGLNLRSVLVYRFPSLRKFKSLGMLQALFGGFQEMRIRGFERKVTQRAISVEQADESFDELWQKTKTLYPNTNVRTSESLNWHCFAHQSFRKHIFGCLDQNNSLVGYAIFWVRQLEHLRVMECVDLWYDISHSNAIHTLISFSLRYAKTNKFDVVEVPHFNQAIYQVCRELRFSRKKYRDRKDLYLSKPDLEREMNPVNSYFVSLQGDFLL